MLLKTLRLTDFKGVRSAEYDFSDVTKIMGQNGSGKSTIATAWYWLWMDKDYELKSNPNIRPNEAEESIPRVEAVLDIKGTEVTIAKQQKRTVGKPNDKGISRITLANTYEINQVPKTERDFRADLEDRGIVFEKFLALSHPEVFTGQKAADMRKILFEMVSEKSDLDIAMLDQDTRDVAELLKSYKFEEIATKYKSSKQKAEKQVKSIPDQIVGMEKSKADIDVAELELRKNCIRDQIAEKEALYDDCEKALEDVRRQRDDLMQLQMDISAIESQANDVLLSEKRKLREMTQEANQKFHAAEMNHKQAEKDIERFEAELQFLEQEKGKLQNQWKQTKAETYREYEELPELDENDLVCPTCGQELPLILKEKKVAENESRIKQHKEKYDSEKKQYEEDKRSRLSTIEKFGSETVAKIKGVKVALENLRQQINDFKSEKIAANKEYSEADQKLKALPEKPDLSDNQEYERMCLEFHAKSEAMHYADKSGNYRSSLKADIEVLRQELSEVEKELGKASNNIRIDEQILEMQKKQREYGQAKADSEKILYQLSLVSKKKNELLVEEINANFSIVKWILFDYQKNGEYKETCIPTVEGRRFGDSTNTGREIVAKLDICNSLQEFFGINLPVFLDNAESINDFNIPDMGCQLILMNVTEDENLKLENVA